MVSLFHLMKIFTPEEIAQLRRRDAFQKRLDVRAEERGTGLDLVDAFGVPLSSDLLYVDTNRPSSVYDPLRQVCYVHTSITGGGVDHLQLVLQYLGKENRHSGAEYRHFGGNVALSTAKGLQPYDRSVVEALVGVMGHFGCGGQKNKD